LKRLAPALAALLLLAACSSLSLGWRVAPWYLEHQAQGLLQLQGPAHERLKADLDIFLHRSAVDEGPSLAGLSDALATALRESRDADALNLAFGSLEEECQRLVQPALAPAARLVALAQPAALQAGFKKDNAVAFARWQGWTRKEGAARLEKRLQEWLGPLGPAQVKLAEAWAEAGPFPSLAWRAERLHNQKLLVAAVQAKAGPLALEDLLSRGWFVPWASPASAAWKGDEARVRDWLGQLLASLSPAQRLHLAQRFHGYAADLRKISAQEKARPSLVPAPQG
jgi:hypothetical protein